MLLQSFFKQKPTQDTPYRTLAVHHNPGWQITMSGGIEWGPEHRQELKVIPAKSFDEAMELYNRMFAELQDEGWKAYSPIEMWD